MALSPRSSAQVRASAVEALRLMNLHIERLQRDVEADLSRVAHLSREELAPLVNRQRLQLARFCEATVGPWEDLASELCDEFAAGCANAEVRGGAKGCRGDAGAWMAR